MYRRVLTEGDVSVHSEPLVLALRGLRSHPTNSRLVTDFVSQERRETFVYLYGQVSLRLALFALAFLSETLDCAS
jgi:hypothetical protein